MSVPTVNLEVSLDTSSSVLDETSSTGIYDIIGSVVNDTSSTIDIYKRGEASPFVTLPANASSNFGDSGISLPELMRYKVKYTDQDEYTYVSVNHSHFSVAIDSVVFDNALVRGDLNKSAPTEYGVPVCEIRYEGPSLTDYSSLKFTDELYIVPYYVTPGGDVSATIGTGNYIEQDNQSFLMSYGTSTSLENNGRTFAVKEGYCYLTLMTTPGVVKFDTLNFLLKKNNLMGNGLEINIYEDSAGTPGVTAVSSSFIKNIDISTSLSMVTVELDEQMSLKNFWVEIIPANIDSEYEIALSNLSFNTALKASRYTTLFESGASEGLTYSEVLVDKLDSVYGSGSYPVLVTSSEESVQLNSLFIDTFNISTGFDGPCIVSYTSLSLLQIANNGIEVGPAGNTSSSELVSQINAVENYNAFISTDTSLEENSLYTEFRTPEIDSLGGATDSELGFSQFEAPNGNHRRIVVRTASMAVSYPTPSTIQLKTPTAGSSGEWYPTISPGFVPAISYEIGDEVYVDGFGTDTVSAVGDRTITLTNNGAVDNPTHFATAAGATQVVTASEAPVQLSEDTFQLSRGPIYVDGTPAITFVTGDRLEKDFTSNISDWDADNSVFTLNKKVKFETTKFVKYKYLEDGYVFSTDLRSHVDSSFDIFLGSNGLLVNTEIEENSYVTSSILYIKIGSYKISTLTTPEDINIRDIRKRGGGLVYDMTFEEAFKKNVGVVGFYDIGFHDGRNIPQMVLTANIPEGALSRIEDHEIEEEIHKHAVAGTKIIKEFK